MAFSLKENVLSITTGISTIGFVIGAFLMVDERYAHAQEVKATQLAQASQIQQLRVETTKKFYRSKIDEIEQRQFDIKVKPKHTPIDQAYLQRYATQVEKLKEEEKAEIQAIKEGN